MKKRLLVISCLVLLHPHAALPAQDLPRLPASFPLFALLLLLSVGAAGWFYSRLRRLEREKSDILVRLQLAQQALEHTPLALLWTDPGFKIIQANRSALQAAGDGPLIGRDLRELHPELDKHPFVTAPPTGQQGAVSLGSADTFHSPDSGMAGNETLSLVAADSQNFAVWSGMPFHGSVQRSEEGEGDKTNGAAQAMESASRMKSEFIANINHEIRTPMNAIIGYAEMLINANLGSREKRFVDIIHKSSLTLVSIFNDIMELSKIDSGRAQVVLGPVRLQSLITEVEELFKELAHEKNLRFRCRIAPHLPQVLILDRIRLKQILQNLVSNAVKFTAKGYVELMVDGKLSQDNDGCVDLRFRVEDSGIGIPAADQEKIFELFQQQEDTITKKYGGVGLGLTLCSRLTAMIGGSIELFSNEGHGARFTVFLHAVKVAEQTSADLLPDVNVVMNEREQKLLIVDDMDLIKDVFIDFFQGSSFTILTASTSEEALALAAREQPGMIFMDLNLVGTNGRMVTERLRNQTETAMIPVIVMTGDILDEADYKPLFDDLLQKPFRLEELKEIVARYVSLGQTAAPPSSVADSAIDDEQVFFDAMVGKWTEELEQLCRQAVRSGSLTDAISLGTAMLEAGKMAPQSQLSKLGEALVHYAAEPNILGVDRLLAKLTSIANRK